MTAFDEEEARLRVGPPADHVAGLQAVRLSLANAVRKMGVRKTVRNLRTLNQHDGVDCMSCAWPDPQGRRHTAEFCENGAKAVSWEGQRDTVGPEFFAAHGLADLAGRTDHWLEKQGRLTHPMVRRDGGTHYEPISWDDAFTLIGSFLKDLDSPDEAAFYTSGRASNEAAFVYQLLARALGTNNLPDCSNMCHESTGTALMRTIGMGKGSVTLEDLHQADLIVVSGQNPGTNHPRMLTALEIAKRDGAKILAINPLPEAGLIRFDNPQNVRGLVGAGTPLADRLLRIRSNGDLALWQAIGHLLLLKGVADREFIASSTVGFDAWAEHVAAVDRDTVLAATGLSWDEIEAAADMLASAKRIVHCWAMGITQHRNAVATIKEFVNVALLQGMIGKPGAGLCPVRGHSNVQGDRSMGIWEKPPAVFLDRLRDEFGFEPPRAHGHDAVDTVRAFRDGRAKVFIALGGNFVGAMSDTEVTAAAMRDAALTVQISTKLNRSHVEAGRTALILPTLGRTEQDLTGGRVQRVTVEDSMSAVHASRGRSAPVGPLLRSEVDIVCGIAAAALGDRHGIPWAGFAADYEQIRERIGRVVPGCDDYAAKIRDGGFTMPHPPRDSRTFPTAEGKAVFTVSPVEVMTVPEGRLVLQTLRSHDQFNTTIYGLDDRYRGISQGRRVVFISDADLTELGFADGDVVDLVSEWADGAERRAERFRLVAYDTPKGCVAAYYPETNPLVPLDSQAEESGTPTSKWVQVRLERIRT
ncbi:molybdopterin-dependent oxidoreductase alpha subunit [Actinoplanes campanulatus]|uniref:Molybdopterin-dependent oxidoreductase alpha subunit n=1 Tax=Actinoplanes campanulatus TaxID=113559 RepID=A0A7W5ACK1_9ACTN|nr:FdhF/YdeP family oxidoreductase [Actinoplanes campanulatus]MBB3093782.1 molybdopterin-dependent oxidoreductase alpha subunit [Actinoplanes campanulatus]GGN05645.1 formate dehydrogenase subunit alpha [Actinoplanes campanulatus]GID35140.1 formate dehydrogenase subunit alpha [Actinoplanes campanulatus]